MAVSIMNLIRALVSQLRETQTHFKFRGYNYVWESRWSTDDYTMVVVAFLTDS